MNRMYRKMRIENLRATLLLTAGALLAAMAGIGITGCGKGHAKAAPASGPIPVTVIKVGQKDVSLTGNWVGTLDGFLNVQIQPEVSGYLISQNYKEGSPVCKGQVLFRIDPRLFQAAVAQAQAQVAQARGQLAQAQAQQILAQINLKRDTPLAAAKAIAQSQLDNDKQVAAQDDAAVAAAEAAIKTAEASLATAKLNLGFTQVRSLISGVAGQTAIQTGNLVTPSSVLTLVSQLDPIKVYFSISDAEYLALNERAQQQGSDLLSGHSDLPLSLALANGKLWPYKGHVVWVDRQMNQQTGAIRIAAAFPNPQNMLRPGQFGRVTAETEVHRDALVIPQVAIQELQGVQRVYIAGPDQRVHAVNVTLGAQFGKEWVVNAGLQPGQLVITSNLQKLRDGAAIVPHEVSEQAAIQTSSPTGAR